MAGRGSTSTASIQALLDEKRQYEAWLSKINAVGDATPKSVRSRVKSDYEARLKAVNEQLQGQTDTVRQMVAEKKRRRGELVKEEASAAERLSEAELRRTVGEYEEGQWVTVRADLLKALVDVRETLKTIEQEIEKLEEVLNLAAEKPGGAKEKAEASPKIGPPPKPAEPAARPQVKLPPDEEAPAKKKKQPVDELAFLKSVTEDEEQGPSPKRASGAVYQPKEPPSASAPQTTKVKDEPEEADKTLKCNECGTMNLATEWYCEQCGAELAAL
jgi:hypothetical protein